MQIDFGERLVEIGGAKLRVYLFVATLGYSRRSHIRAFRNERRCRSGSGGNSVGVVSVLNLESSGVGAPERRPRHDKRYHEV